MHCAQVRMESMHEVTGNSCHVMCNECARMKEKCMWLKVVMGSDRTRKGKGVEMSLRAEEKKKQQWKVTAKKAVVDNDNDVELVEGPSKAGPRLTGREGVEEWLNWVVNVLGDLTTVICRMAANHVQLTRQTWVLANMAFKFVSRTFDEYTSELEGPEEFNEDVKVLRAENRDLRNLETLASQGENVKATIAHDKEHYLARAGPAPNVPKGV